MYIHVSELTALLSCMTSLLVVAKDLLSQDLLRSLDCPLSIVVVLAGVDPLFRVDDVLLALLRLAPTEKEVASLVEGDHVRRLRLGSHDDRRRVADEAVVSTDISLLRVDKMFQLILMELVQLYRPKERYGIILLW